MLWLWRLSKSFKEEFIQVIYVLSFKKLEEEFNQVPIHALLFHIVQEGFQPGIKDEKMSTEILLTNMFSVHTIY